MVPNSPEERKANRVRCAPSPGYGQEHDGDNGRHGGSLATNVTYDSPIQLAQTDPAVVLMHLVDVTEAGLFMWL